MRKKLLSILLVFATIIPLASQSVHSYVGDYKDGDLYYNVVDGKAVITDCNEDATDVVIPATINGYSVTEIGEGTFSECDKLETIDIPFGVEIIGDSAFSRCRVLKNVSLPESVTTIETSAFSYCFALTNILLPRSLESIGNMAFNGCNELVNVYYSGSEKELNNVKCYTGIVSIGSGPVYKNASEMFGDDVTIYYNISKIPSSIPIFILDSTKVRYDNGKYQFDIQMENVMDDCKLITVLYNDGILTELKVTDIYEGCDSEIVTVSAEAADIAKIFVWDSLIGMRPLTEETFTYSLNE